MSGQDNMQLLCREFPAGILTQSYNVCIHGFTKTQFSQNSHIKVWVSGDTYLPTHSAKHTIINSININTDKNI